MKGGGEMWYATKPKRLQFTGRGSLTAQDALVSGRSRFANKFWHTGCDPVVALEQFKRWFLADEQWHLRNEARQVLTGKNLACHCPCGQPCHADFLLQWLTDEG